MPTTIKKGALTAAAKKSAESDDKPVKELTDAQLADLYGETKAEIDGVTAPLQELLKMVESELKARAKAAPPGGGRDFNGKRWQVSFSTPRTVRKVTDMAKLLLTIGEEKFLAICSVKIGDLDKVLTKDEQRSAEVIEEVPGSRTMTVRRQP